MSEDRSQRLREARLAKGFETAAAAAEAFGWNRNTYASNENGNAPFSYRRAKEYAAAFDVRPEWLYDASGSMRPAAEGGLVPIIGRVGANPEGTVLFATGQEHGDLAPIPPGGTDKAVALRVVGHSMHGIADDGALIYFEDQRTPPTPDMLGHVVVVETDTDEVLVKRLLRGSRAGLFDLTAIIPPFQARRIIRSAA
jgi:transcriptional regulator with XRE-family HTH domain